MSARTGKRAIGNVGAGLAAALIVAIALLPVLWGLSTSLKPAAQIMTFPPKWLPEPPTLASYQSTAGPIG